MAIDITRINTGGAVVTIGGVIPAANNPDSDGFYWGTVSGTEIGCTQGGITVSYSMEKTDIFCDQTLPAVETSITSESAEVSMNLLESDAVNLNIAMQQTTYVENVGADRKVGVGGVTTITFVPMKLEIIDNDTGNLTTWTFFRVLSNGIEINFERENPTQVAVTFTAYADTSHAAGHQLFSIHEDIS
jgi:hypothetical protein